MLPTTTRHPVPHTSSPDYVTHHTAVHADPRLTGLDDTARYTDHISRDNGRTWQPSGSRTVCAGHVRADMASALLRGRDISVDGSTRYVRYDDSTVTRWSVVSEEAVDDEPTPDEAARHALADIGAVWASWTSGRTATDDAMAAISDHLTAARNLGALT